MSWAASAVKAEDTVTVKIEIFHQNLMILNNLLAIIRLRRCPIWTWTRTTVHLLVTSGCWREVQRNGRWTTGMHFWSLQTKGMASPPHSNCRLTITLKAYLPVSPYCPKNKHPCLWRPVVPKIHTLLSQTYVHNMTYLMDLLYPKPWSFPKHNQVALMPKPN